MFPQKNLKKIHHYLGHAKPEKLKKLIKDAGLWNEQVDYSLQKIGDECSCKVIENRIPKPAVSIPKANKHNQMVSLDLKDWKSGEYKYILYLVDVFSRFTMAKFIKNKEPSTIAEVIMDCWIKFFGRMDAILSDRGGEFLNEEISKLCEYLDVKHIATAAFSPNMNGCNERNHAICDRMLEKMLFEDPTIKVEVALGWAVTAKNSLTNYQGFSPCQIVFGENPKLPAVYTSGPPGLL